MGKGYFFFASPNVFLQRLLRLSRSGISGAYAEPRSADGKDALSVFMAIWTPKHTMHIRQTNPAVICLARVVDRRGFREQSKQAQEVHKVVKPDSLFLPQGARLQFAVARASPEL